MPLILEEIKPQKKLWLEPVGTTGLAKTFTDIATGGLSVPFTRVPAIRRAVVKAVKEQVLPALESGVQAHLGVLKELLEPSGQTLKESYIKGATLTKRIRGADLFKSIPDELAARLFDISPFTPPGAQFLINKKLKSAIVKESMGAAVEMGVDPVNWALIGVPVLSGALKGTRGARIGESMLQALPQMQRELGLGKAQMQALREVVPKVSRAVAQRMAWPRLLKTERQIQAGLRRLSRYIKPRPQLATVYAERGFARIGLPPEGTPQFMNFWKANPKLQQPYLDLKKALGRMPTAGELAQKAGIAISAIKGIVPSTPMAAKSNIQRMAEVASKGPLLEAESLSDDVAYKVIAKGKKYYKENLYGRKIFSPALNENVEFTSRGLLYLNKGSLKDKVRRFKLLPKVEPIIKNIEHIDPQDIRQVDKNHYRYGLIARFKDGSVVRVILDEIQREGKKFLSVFDVEDLHGVKLAKKMGLPILGGQPGIPSVQPAPKKPPARAKISMPQKLPFVKPKIPGKPPIPPTSVYLEELPPEGDPVQKVISALKEAKSVRKIQEKLYTKERAKRLAESLAIGEKIKGEKGFYAELGALKGELPKAQFESIRGKVTQEDIDSLFNMVKDSPLLNEWDKISARQALAKLFGEYGGRVPTEKELVLLNRVFGKEFTKAILDKRSLLEKIKEAGYQIANIPRSIMASFDLSAPFRQGVFLIGRPKQFWPAFAKMFKLFGSEKYFKSIQEAIVRDPLFDLAQKSKLSLTEMGDILTQREERFMSTWAEKIPLFIGKGVRASGRAYMGFLNKLRFDVFKDLVKKAEILGLNPKENIDLTKSIAEFVNSATGRGSLGRFEVAAKVLNTFFFSPRLMASRINLLRPDFYIKQDPFVRKEMLKSLLAFLGYGLTVLTLAKLAGAKVGTDPRSADFGKIKIGNTRIDVWGGFQQLVRLAAQLVKGQVVSSTSGRIITLGEGYRPLTRLEILTRFFEYKQAPIVSFITDWLRGTTAIGEKFSFKKATVQRFIPMVIQDMYDIIKDDPTLFPLSWLGIFGVGVQTYKARDFTKRFEAQYGISQRLNFITEFERKYKLR